MKTILAIALTATLAAAAAGCSKEPPCTAEVLTKKGQELATTMQTAITKDPSKATELATKVQEVATKYQGSTAAEACKAYDDLIATIKG